jgi:hypothetical protein
LIWAATENIGWYRPQLTTMPHGPQLTTMPYGPQSTSIGKTEQHFWKWGMRPPQAIVAGKKDHNHKSLPQSLRMPYGPQSTSIGKTEQHFWKWGMRPPQAMVAGKRKQGSTHILSTESALDVSYQE